MKALVKATEYLERMTGSPVRLRPLPAGDLKGLPLFLVHGNQFFEWRWLDQALILAILSSAGDDEQMETAGMRLRQQTLTGHFHLPVVLVLPSVKAFRRDRFSSYQ